MLPRQRPLGCLTLSLLNRTSTIDVCVRLHSGEGHHTNLLPPAEPMPRVPTDPLEADEHLARLAKAIAHPARVAIVRLLVRQEGCIVGDIVDELPLAQSTVSQHLKQLKEAGLIRGEVDGPRVCCCVEPGAVALLKALVGAL